MNEDLGLHKGGQLVHGLQPTVHWFRDNWASRYGKASLAAGSLPN